MPSTPTPCCFYRASLTVARFLPIWANDYSKVFAVKWMPLRTMCPTSEVVALRAALNIFCKRHRFEMGRIHATANAAQMIDRQIFWDTALSQLVAVSMGVDKPFPVVLSAREKLPVSAAHDCACPQPAPAVWLRRYFIPETIFGFPSVGHGSTLLVLGVKFLVH